MAEDAAGPPPVILYLVDTLRADRLGLYGHGRPTSPRLDALAAESVVFTRAYAAAPWTLPSVASLLTSRYPCEHGLGMRGLRLAATLPTLAERLQALGYATGAYYQNASAGPMAGLDRGYQVSELRPPEDGSLAGPAAEFVARAGGAPFLLYLHTMEPHNWVGVEPRVLREFGHVGVDERETLRALGDVYRMSMLADLRDAPPDVAAAAAADQSRSAAAMDALRAEVDVLYDAAVRQADENLGRVIDALQASGAWDRAAFVVLSDHGEEFGEHGEWFHGQSVYEELVRVPLLVRLPGGAHGGRRVDARVSLLDVMPTLLELAGAPACEGCAGRSLLALARGEDAAGWRPAEVAALRLNDNYVSRRIRERRGEVNVALVDGAAKAIWNRDPAEVELYDLAADPAERQDRAAADPPRAQAAAAQAADWLARCEARREAPVPVPEAEMDEKTRENLRALGYLR